LLQGDAAEAQKSLSKLLLQHLSYFSSGSSHPETVYQMFLFGLLLSEFGGKSESYVVDMEKEVGYGRYDIRCWPTHRDHKTEIIIELKAVSLSKKSKNRRVKKSKKELEKYMNGQLETTMEQLESRAYYLQSREYVTTVHEFGICFAGKLCVVGSRTRTREGTDGAGWTVTKWTTPGAQFQKSEFQRQTFDTTVEEELEKRDGAGNHGQREGEYVETTAGSPPHYTAMEIKPTGGISMGKRKSSQLGDGDTGTCGYRIFDA
jgi:hypothetical protein